MRLLSYNIHKGIGGRDQRYDLARVIGVIEDQNPDLVCLQEVDRGVRRSRHEDQPALLAEALRCASWLYQLNVHVQRGGYGNLILSRWPMLRHHQVSLRHHQRKPRGAQIAVIETPEGELHLVNCHLGLSDRERRWQVEHLLGHRLFRESIHLPTVIAGDTNDWRERLMQTVFVRHGFVQLTAPPSRYRSFPAYMALSSLDKAFARGEVELRRAHIVRTPLSHQASDHLPLVVDFHLGANGNGAV